MAKPGPKPMFDKTMVQFTCKLPSTTIDSIQQLAVLHDTSIGEVTRRLLEDGASKQIERDREEAR